MKKNVGEILKASVETDIRTTAKSPILVKTESFTQRKNLYNPIKAIPPNMSPY